MMEFKQTNQHEWVLLLLVNPYQFIGKSPPVSYLTRNEYCCRFIDNAL